MWFAETCFGDQLGIRWEGRKEIPILFSMDTFESFVVADSVRSLFEETLADPFGLIDPVRWESVRRALGPLAESAHYAPVVSPLIGGTASESNFVMIDATVHLRTAMAEYGAINEIPPIT